MKKVITIVMIICIMLCGCSKSEPQTTPTTAPTSEPTKEPTQAPTETPTTAPTETPTETPAEPTQEPSDAELICELCMEKPAEYIYKDHLLCYDCYFIALKNETDVENYKALVECCNIAATYEDVIKELSSMGTARIFIGADGVSFENAGANLVLRMQGVLPDLLTMTTAQDCEVQMGLGEYGISVTMTTKPIKWQDVVGK